MPLDHTGATPGSLTLAYARDRGDRDAHRHARRCSPAGRASRRIPFTSDFATELVSLSSGYDLVVPDMRGTGDSSAVHCGAVDTAAEVAACGNKLGALRPFLSTAMTAEDLEDLRAALGVDKLTLYGVSYGTKVGGRVRAPLPRAHGGGDPRLGRPGRRARRHLAAARSSRATRMLREVCKPGGLPSHGGRCRRRTGHGRQRGAHAPGDRPGRGAERAPPAALVTERLLYAVLAASDVSPALRSGLPAAVKSLARGDAAPLLHLATLPTGPARPRTSRCPAAPATPPARTSTWPASWPRRASRESCPGTPHRRWRGGRTRCTPSARRSPARSRRSTRQVVLADSTASLCTSWPPTPAPPAVPVAGPDVPVLILSGRDDLRTPLEDALHTQQTYPHAQLLAVPDVGHDVLGSDFSGCAEKGVVDFLAGRTVESCGKRVALPPAGYLPATIAHLRTERPGGRAGRTLRAVALSVTAVEHDSRLRLVAGGGAGPVPGVRAGWARLSNKKLSLHGYSLFSGMRVTGTLRPAGVLTISGPGAADGRLTFTRHSLVGTLGGVVVRRG